MMGCALDPGHFWAHLLTWSVTDYQTVEPQVSKSPVSRSCSQQPAPAALNIYPLSPAWPSSAQHGVL